MPTNRDLQVRLTLKDEMSKRITGVKNRLRSFAASFRKNWLQITAAITAAIMALRKAFEWTEMGAKAEQIESSFRAMAESMGLDFKKLREEIMKTSAETVNFSNVADKVSALMAQGLSMEQIVGLMRQARAEAIIFGTTTELAFQNIASAVTGGLVTTLRRAYGLQLSLKEATESYAAKTGKTKEEVQKYYMAQAIANHILEQGKAHLDAVNLSMMSHFEYIQKLKAQWMSFKETVGQVILKIGVFIKGLFSLLASGATKIIELFVILGRKMYYPIRQLERILNKGRKLMGLEPIKIAEEDYKGIENIRKLWSQTSQELADDAHDTWSVLFAEVEGKSKAAKKIIAEHAKNAGVAVDNASGAADKSAKEHFNYMEEMAKQSAHNIQNAFSSFFFKAFKGELNNLKDVFTSFGDAMLQTIANIIAQLMVMRTVQTFFPSWAGILGFHSGGEVPRRHSGGPIPVPVRAHSGMYLASDEVPIIAQTGEGILSRRAMRTIGTEGLDRLNSGRGLGNQIINNNHYEIHIHAIDAPSFEKRLSQSSGIINGVVMKAVDMNKSTRHVLRNKL